MTIDSAFNLVAARNLTMHVNLPELDISTSIPLSIHLPVVVSDVSTTQRLTQPTALRPPQHIAEMNSK